jgi:hypothetical protein
MVFDVEIAVDPRHHRNTDLGLLDYLRALSFDFQRNDQTVSAVLIYAEPDPASPGHYHAVVAADTGYEGVACVDDTARAALLALGVYERCGSRAALALARRWLTFVEYMQYPDGSFANFIRNAAGVRNASGSTSHRGGYWWSSRALWALARAYRLTGHKEFLERYRSCRLPPIEDGKINGLLALAEMEVYRADPSATSRDLIVQYCNTIQHTTGDAPYLLDHPSKRRVALWGYHQFHALAAAAELLERPDLMKLCRRTVDNLVEPDVRACMWHTYPAKQKNGVTAYDVSTLAQGLATMHSSTGAKRYRQLALQACAWFYGRNDARTPMYDPTTGQCRDGISHGVASLNYGAESAIEAGFTELVRRDLLAE